MIDWLASARLEQSTDEASALAEFERIWKERGPTEHAFAADYRRLAEKLVRTLVQLGADRRFRQSEPLTIDFATGRVLVTPDETAELSDGTIVLRRIRTGHKRKKDEYDRLEYTLYQLAGRARFGEDCQVEAVHLGDQSRELVSITPRKIESRKSTSAEIVEAINRGNFPPEVDAFSCPRCPHFFVCAAAPPGSLTLK
jgi:DNA helicase-2/ATP-dependent DNA helicase PcrA